MGKPELIYMWGGGIKKNARQKEDFGVFWRI
jgi:hypothetical protein